MGYQLSYDMLMDTNFVSKNLNWGVFENRQKKILKKKKIEKIFDNFFFLSSTFKSVKSPASGKENVRFPDSPDFENLPDIRTGRDVR